VVPSGERTQSEGETFNLLLAIHFPNSIVMERRVVRATACRAKILEWRVAVTIVTYQRVE